MVQWSVFSFPFPFFLKKVLFYAGGAKDLALLGALENVFFAHL